MKISESLKRKEEARSRAMARKATARKLPPRKSRNLKGEKNYGKKE
jgi:hypothetical protein